MLSKLLKLFAGGRTKRSGGTPGSCSIAVVFDIDSLGGGLYGAAAFKIFFATADPARLRCCDILDGDTPETLSGKAREYCIAVHTKDAAVGEYIKTAFREIPAKGLAPGKRRFNERVDVNFLSATGYVDSAGALHVRKGGLVSPFWANGTAWTINKED